MRFSKAPLIATLMAVALSLLVILPALAENTNGEVTQGRGTAGELIVGVYDSNDLNGDGMPDADTLRASRDIPGTPLSRNNQPTAFDSTIAQDTFSNGKLYVSNRHDAKEEASSVEGGYNTVLVTQLGPTADVIV